MEYLDYYRKNNANKAGLDQMLKFENSQRKDNFTQAVNPSKGATLYRKKQQRSKRYNSTEVDADKIEEMIIRLNSKLGDMSQFQNKFRYRPLK